MSHLVARLGDLFHFHTLARKTAVPAKPLESAGADPMSVTTAPRGADDLAFFSLSVERPVHDRRSDLDRLGLIDLGEEPLQELD